MRISPIHSPLQHKQRGAVAVEFAVVALVFFLIVFGTIELARILYIYNTLADVTRSTARAAANIDWRKTDELDKAKQRAIFRDSSGVLPFGAPVTDKHIRIDYLYLTQQDGTFRMEPISSTSSGTMPSCPGRNRHNCLTSPYSSATGSSDTCIRFVRVRICKPGSSGCERVAYQPLLSILDWNMSLPISTTIANAETLGYHSGDPICT